MRVCVRACVRACEHTCVSVCLPACLPACLSVQGMAETTNTVVQCMNTNYYNILFMLKVKSLSLLIYWGISVAAYFVDEHILSPATI